MTQASQVEDRADDGPASRPVLLLPGRGPLQAAAAQTARTLLPGAHPAASDDLARVAAQIPGAWLFVPWPDPVDALAAALGSGAAPRDALEAWSAATSAFLQQARRLRRRLVLVDSRLLADGEPRLLAALAGRLGGALPSGAVATGSPPPPDAQSLLFAAALIEHDRAAHALAEELATLRVGPTAGLVGPVTVGNAVAMRRETEAAAARLASLDAEVADLRLAVAGQIEVLEAAEAARAEAERVGAGERRAAATAQAALADAQDELGRQTRSAGQALAAATRDLEALRAEAGRAADAARQARDDLALARATADAARADAAAAAGRAAELAAECALLREALALQVEAVGDGLAAQGAMHADLNAARRDAQALGLRLAEAERSRAALAADTGEREAHLLRGRLRRDALLGEVLLDDAAQLRAARADHARHVAGLEAAVAALEHGRDGLAAELAAARAAAAAADGRAAGLQADVDRIVASKSWKLTGPLRALRRALSGPRR